MVFQLGSLVFDKLLGFSAMEQTTGSRIAVLELIDNKAILQRTGTDLSQIKVSIGIHQQHDSPTEIYRILDDYRESGEILPLLVGNGDVIGTYIVRSIVRIPGHVATNGTVISQVLDLDLIESVDPNPQATAAANLESRSFAKPTAITVDAVPLTPTPAAAVMQNVTGANAGITSGAANINAAAANPTTQGSKLTTAASQIKAARDKAVEALDKLNTANELAAEAALMAGELTAVIAAANATLASLAIGDIANAVTNATAMTDASATMLVSSSQLNIKLISRVL